MLLLIDLADNEFGRSDYGQDEARILFALSVFKDPIKADYLTSGIKKALNLLWHVFT